MTDKVIGLAEQSGHMKHSSVEELLSEALKSVRKNPELFKKCYIVMREDEGDIRHMHHARAGFINDHESLGYLVEAVAFRTSEIRSGSWGD